MNKESGIPVVSVIVPVYNVEEYLSTCLDSIINQTLKEIEIICINDGSTDGSLAILEEYAKKDNRIKIINKKNQGVGKVRNIGIKIARGKFVCFIDSDDKYPENDVLETLYSKATENKVLICGGEFGYFTNQTPNVDATRCDKGFEGYWFESDGMINYRDYQFDYGYHRFLYDRDMLLKNRIFYPSYKRFQDPPFFVRAMLCAGEFYAVRKYTYGYRCQHRKVKWTQEKVLDLFRGIREDLRLAKKNKLEKLSEYSYLRLRQHFRHNPTIRENINWKSLLVLNELPKYNPKISEYISENRLTIWEDNLKPYLKSKFYIRNIGCHKVLCVFGVKLKIKLKKLVERQRYKYLESRINNMEKELSELKERVNAES